MWENDKFSMREDKDIEKIEKVTFLNTIFPRIKDRHRHAWEEKEKIIKKYGPTPEIKKYMEMKEIERQFNMLAPIMPALEPKEEI